MLRAIQAGERVRHFETVRLRKGGQPIDVSLTISPVFDSEGAIVGASHVARDITGSKQFEERVQQIQKLEGLGTIAGGIARDFTRLLSGISGSAGRALDALPPDSPARAELADVAREAERASLLTRQILAYAAKRRYAVETLSLSDVVKEIAHLLEALIPPNVQLRLELDARAPCVEGDAGQLQQAIMNLVVNAAEAIGSGDESIVVRTGALEVEESAGLAATPYAALEVHDTGCGMDEGAQSRNLRRLLHDQAGQPRARSRGGAGNRARPSRLDQGLQRARVRAALSKFLFPYRPNRPSPPRGRIRHGRFMAAATC